MATKGRPSDPDVSVSTVEKELRDEPYVFEFFQAVRLLERLFPGKSPVGRFNPPGSEVVRFAANSTLAFPASEVQALAWPAENAPGKMKVNFMGLTGPEGVMPLYYTSLLAERARAEIILPPIFSISSITASFRYFIWLGKNTDFQLPMNGKVWTHFRITCWI